MISRLKTKLESALSRAPLDLDFLLFTCRQELYLFEALSRHVNISPELVLALQELLRLVMDHIEQDDVTRNTVQTVTCEMGWPRYSIEEERLIELLEINLPVHYIAMLLGVSASMVN